MGDIARQPPLALECLLEPSEKRVQTRDDRRELRLRYLALENVPGFLGSRVDDLLRETLERSGYMAVCERRLVGNSPSLVPVRSMLATIPELASIRPDGGAAEA